jgi:hypothetical protein
VLHQTGAAILACGGKSHHRPPPLLSLVVPASVHFTYARERKTRTCSGPTRRGKFALRRFLLRTSRPKDARQSVQPPAVRNTAADWIEGGYDEQ